MLYSENNMQEVTVFTVQGLLERLDSIEKDTEHLYLDLGTIFPAIKASIDESAANTESAIRTILVSYRHGVSAEQAKRRSDEFIADSSSFFEKAAAKEKNFFLTVEASIAELSQLDDIIGRVRLDSEEMELVSLNAMTVALKSGSAGKAFSVITDELKRLSSRTIQYANELSLVGSDLLVYLAQLRTELTSLEENREKLFSGIMATLTKGFQDLDQQVAAIADGFRGLATTVASVRNPVFSIMQGVQVQDIIRQSLDHVRLSLKVVLDDSQPPVLAETTGAKNAQPTISEEKAFLAEITRLSSLLLEDIHAKVCQSLGNFEESMAEIDTLVAAVDGRKQHLFKAQSGGRDFGVLAQLENAYVHAKRRVSQTARHVAEGVQRLDERFNAVHAILSRFNNIVIASRIEIARNKALGMVANTVSGMMELTQRLSEDVSAAGTLTRSFSKSINNEMLAYLGNDEGYEQREFDGAMQQLRAEFERLQMSGTELQQAVERFQPFAESFDRAIGKAKAHTERIRALAGELDTMRHNLAGHASAIEKELGITMQDTMSGRLEIRNNRLKEIVDRFTIFTHRQTASRVAHLDDGSLDDNGEAASSGEVTLF